MLYDCVVYVWGWLPWYESWCACLPQTCVRAKYYELDVREQKHGFDTPIKGERSHEVDTLPWRSLLILRASYTVVVGGHAQGYRDEHRAAFE